MANEAFPSISGAMITTSPSPTTAASSPAMNVIGVIRKAIKLLIKNEKLLTLQVFLLALFPFSLLVLLHYLVAAPLMHKVEDTYEMSSLDPKDAIALVGIEIPFFVAFCVVSLFAMSITISASALTNSGKSPSVEELMLRTLSTWKKPIISWLYVSLLMIAYVVVSLVSTQLIGSGTNNTTNATSACSWLLGILAASLYPYFASLWTLVMVISIVEEDECYGGANALAKARTLLVGRKLLHGFFLMLILLLLNIPVYVLFCVTTADDDDELGSTTRFAFMFVATLLFCLTNSFTFVVYTVFYFECKQSHGGHGGEKIGVEFGPGYHLLPTTVYADSI